MVWIICILVLTNTYLILLISNITVFFSNILKAILWIIFVEINSNKNKCNILICILI